MNNLETLVKEAQAGDEGARDHLVRKLKDNDAMKSLNRYLYKNRLLDPDDVRGEFWLGVAKALDTVRCDIGDPFQFLAWKGLNQVRDALRKAIRHGAQYACRECGHTGGVHRMGREMMCKACGSSKLDTMERKASDLVDLSLPARTIKTSMKIDLEEFRVKLSVQEERVYSLIEQGYDKEGSVNYLKDIGSILGISAQCVNIYLKKIRNKLSEHLGEEV